MVKNRKPGAMAGQSEDDRAGELIYSENTPPTVPTQDEQRRAWLLLQLNRAYFDALERANEARGIFDALDRRMIGPECAAWWALQAGALEPEPARSSAQDHWAEAALEWRRQKYGLNGLLEGGR